MTTTYSSWLKRRQTRKDTTGEFARAVAKAIKKPPKTYSGWYRLVEKYGDGEAMTEFLASYKVYLKATGKLICLDTFRREKQLEKLWNKTTTL